ncbi:MAG: hypothetical protein M3Q27_17105, partial [Actinomycetota bacterium]|nr:hypothetical protein [Actinomycetota bacterium]
MREHPAPTAEILPDAGLDRLLQLTALLGHGQQHEAGQTQHRRRRATVINHLGPPLDSCPDTTNR